MSDSELNQLREKNWRRRLTPAEAAELQAWLGTHPEARADWETEAELTEAMSRLPDAQVPGNFTARVLEAVERESAAQKRAPVPVWTWLLRSYMPRAAVAAVVLGTVLLTYREHTAEKKQAEVVEGVKMVSGVSSLPSPEVLQDFDTIRKMNTTTGPDPELIALMK